MAIARLVMPAGSDRPRNGFFGLTESTSYVQRLSAFMQEHVLPAEPEYAAKLQNLPDWRSWKQPAVMEQLKAKARAAGLWNLFLPDREYGAGLSNVEYAPLAEITGRSSIAPGGFQLQRSRHGQHGSAGEIRIGSAKAALAQAAARGRDSFRVLHDGTRGGFLGCHKHAGHGAHSREINVVFNGREMVEFRNWSSSLPAADLHGLDQSLGLEDMSVIRWSWCRRTPGVKIERMVPVFGSYDPPFGHGEVSFTMCACRWTTSLPDRDADLRSHRACCRIPRLSDLPNQPGRPGGGLFAQRPSRALYGAELELTGRPIRDLDLSAGLGYTDARYERFTEPAAAGLSGGPVVLDGKPISFVPEFTANLSARYRLPWQHFYIHGEVIAVGRNHLDDSGNVASGPVVQSTYFLANAQVGWETRHLNIYFFARNIFDRHYYNNALNLGPAYGSLILQPGDPATYGIAATARF